MSSATFSNRPRFVSDESVRAYDGVFVFFHWTIVLLLLVQYLTKPLQWAGVWPAQSANYWHISLGPTILLVMVLRLIWRWCRPVPPPPSDLSLELQVVSRSNHWALYAMVILQCLGGWFTASAAGVAPELLGFIRLPLLIPKDPALAHRLGFWHGLGALLLLALIMAHIAGALYHALGKRDGVIQRILPFGDPPAV
ncbi:MAG: cytochrome b/b6 domain-containing protein [Acetobacteraceae bacterium]|nr:cytochrome b/b6 domain-containing protein [Acetobacteraceae bacterium]